MNVYDFDNTIYNGDSTIEFYRYCLKKYPKVRCCIPKQLLGLFFYILNVFSKKRFKESFFSFLEYVPNTKEVVEEFWNTEEGKIFNWYIEKKLDTDVVISASPEFLVRPIAKKLGVLNVIATEVDEKSGRFCSENCYGEEKLRRLKENKIFAEEIVEEFYSDTYSDKPLADIAVSSYLVVKGKIEAWPQKNPKRCNLLEMIRYGFWGAVTTLLNLCLFILFVNIGIPYLVSNVSTYFIAVAVSFFLNEKFVFNNNRKTAGGTLQKMIKFFSVRIFSVLIDSGLLMWCVEILEIPIFLSKILVSIIIIFMTYVLNRFFVFEKES